METKPGIKTTEFWAAIFSTLIITGASEFGIYINETSALSIAAVTVTYIAGRVFHKSTMLNSTSQ